MVVIFTHLPEVLPRSVQDTSVILQTVREMGQTVDIRGRLACYFAAAAEVRGGRRDFLDGAGADEPLGSATVRFRR